MRVIMYKSMSVRIFIANYLVNSKKNSNFAAKKIDKVRLQLRLYNTSAC